VRQKDGQKPLAGQAWQISMALSGGEVVIDDGVVTILLSICTVAAGAGLEAANADGGVVLFHCLPLGHGKSMPPST